MKTYKQIYAAIDLHCNTSVLGLMDPHGKPLGKERFATTAENLVSRVKAIEAERIHLTIEQGNMAFWAGLQVAPYVDKLIICDPRKNKLVSHNDNKGDKVDTKRLCQLLRMGALKPVWRPKQMDRRRLLFHQVKEYHRAIKTITIHKRQMQAILRHWGYNRRLRRADYKRPEQLLDQLDDAGFAVEVAAKFELIGQLSGYKDRLLKRMKKLGRQFWEISEFRKIPGIGLVGAHTFSGYIQTPHRFRRSGQLMRFCQLAVRKRSSDGQNLASERLSRAGHGQLKYIAHVAWKSALCSDNEVRRYFRACLQASGNSAHARLATQRKILTTMWALWKNQEPYDAEQFEYNYGG